jgi:CheY-like chemotaxis protein
MMDTPRILLVEDNRMDVELIRDAFRETGLAHEVDIAENGERALDYLIGRGDDENRSVTRLPDLVLLDLKMPGIDGFEVLRRVKSTSGLRRIPVIVLTSSREEGDRAMSYDLGANSYLVKPVSFEGFVALVRVIHGYWVGANVAPPGKQVLAP